MGSIATFIQKYTELYNKACPSPEPAQVLPSEETLVKVFDLLMDVSCMREEGRFSNFRVCFLNSDDEDYLGGFIYSHKLDFETPVPFVQSAMHKLAPAINPTMSYLILDTTTQPFTITGIIAAYTSWEKSLIGESEGGARMPRIPNFMVKGPGEIEACLGETPLISYTFGHNIVSRTDAFDNGFVADAIKSKTRLEESEWKNILFRVIYHMKKYAHGGTIILVPDDADFSNVLDIKYVLPAQCMFKEAKSIIDISETAREKEVVSFSDFVSKLTTVDGAVVMNMDFDLKGFGAEILTDRMDRKTPDMFFYKDDNTENKNAHFNDNGTRHRSGYRFVNAVEGSVVIIVSQDGIIKACTKNGGKVYVYNNIAIAI